MIDQSTEAGKALQAVVKAELKNYLGKDYDDDVLPLYIVVMLAHGNQQPLVADNLDAFLGKEKAVLFAQWLFSHLSANPGKYDAAEVSQTVVEPAAPEDVAPMEKEQPNGNDDSGRKRRREKREKIEWSGETAKVKSREGGRDIKDSREEKRRKSRDDDRTTERGDKEHDRDRDHRRSAMQETRELESARSKYDGRDARTRHPDRDSDRHERRHRRDAGREGDDQRSRRQEPDLQDRRETKERNMDDRHREDGPSEGSRPVQASGRLAGRIGLPGALTRPFVPRPKSASPKPREEARPSVFERLKADNEVKGHETRTKMRMDAVPASKITEAASPLYDPVTDTALPTIDMNMVAQQSQDLASELRQIRESLARLQADKVNEALTRIQPSRAQTDTLLAAINSRKAVVHNVHFNASPDILKAHFSGCGNVVSAIVEKDLAGNPKGLAMIEFEEESARKTALTLSGSLLLGRPITVYAKESAPKYAPAGTRAPMSGYRPRAPAPGRGAGRAFGRSTFPGRTTLKNNKYVRPQAPQAQEANAGV